jgi:hypothetical protein
LPGKDLRESRAAPIAASACGIRVYGQDFLAEALPPRIRAASHVFSVNGIVKPKRVLIDQIIRKGPKIIKRIARRITHKTASFISFPQFYTGGDDYFTSTILTWTTLTRTS